MERKVYMEKLFSKRREKLIDMCIELQKQGEKFLYIMPSSAAIRQVRSKLIDANGGFLGSQVIVFDDLEMNIVKEEISESKIIFEPVGRLIVSEICNKLKEDGKLNYYKKLYNKKGFHSEILVLIRSLKRSCIDEDTFAAVKENIGDEVLKDKMEDLLLIYKQYNFMLRENGIYDRNDIPVKALELIQSFSDLNKFHSIIIDGFTDIEIVSIKLIEKIAKFSNINIYVNCPYINSFMEDFLNEEIRKPFENMGFQIISDNEEFYNIKDDFRELSNKFYSGESISCAVEGLSIKAYPCIKSEIRETARDIKEKLLQGERPEDIAVYVNNKENYSETIAKIFQELNIPVSINYEIPIGSSELIRKIVKGMGDIDENTNSGEYWFSLLQQQIEDKKDHMARYVEKIFNSDIDINDKFELMAFEGFKNLLHEMKFSFEKSKILSKNIDKDSFIQLLSECIQGITVVVKRGSNSGVRILNTALAKGIYFKHVYILGLNEGEIPKCVKNNGLFDKFETSMLSEKGIRYKDYLWELNREKIRFNLSIASAEKTLNLSYRSASEDGKFAIASSFIDEIKFISNIDKIKSLSMRNRFELKYDKVMSSYELKTIYIKDYFRSKYLNNETGVFEEKKDLIESQEESIRQVLDKGLVEYHREREKDFNQYEGILGSDFYNIAELLCKFTPSSLNEYTKCPFRYMMNVLFKLGEEEEDDSELSNIEIGNFYHNVLYRYYNGARQFEYLEEELFESAFSKSFDELRKLNISQEQLDMIVNDLYSVIKNFIYADIKRICLFAATKKGSVLRPYMLEQILEDNENFGVNIKCKIDRVDLEYIEEGNKLIPTGRYIIYDYKKKSIPEIKDILQGNDNQLAIYYYIVEKRLKTLLKTDQVECMALLYLSIEKTEDSVVKDGIYKTEYKKELDFGSKRSDINGDKFNLLMEYIKESILDTIASIKNGNFNYKPMCNFFEDYSLYSCEYERLCRYSKNKIRVLMGE